MTRDPGSARDAVLRRVREATTGARDGDADAAYAALPRAYRAADAGADRASLLDRLQERLGDYGVRVVRTAAVDLPAALAREVDARAAGRVVMPPDAPAAWRAALAGRTLVRDEAAAAELDAADATVTACSVAIAETGTIVLDGGPGQGRRAASLVPDVHLCVVAASQVVALVPEAIERLAPAARAGRPLTWISGPSATSDIELVRVAGVHGPRALVVLLVVDA